MVQTGLHAEAYSTSAWMTFRHGVLSIPDASDDGTRPRPHVGSCTGLVKAGADAFAAQVDHVWRGIGPSEGVSTLF